jgi:hypothetical protein
LNVSSNNSAQASKTIALTDVSLEQNAPNPFIKATTIQYVLPQKFISAQIVFTDYTGKILRQVNLSGSGKGTIHINTSSLASGTYNYSLMVDGKISSTKQMVIAK